MRKLWVTQQRRPVLRWASLLLRLSYPPPEGDAVTTETPQQPASSDLLRGTPRAIPARGLSEEDCRKFGYLVGQKANGDQVQIAVYRDKMAVPSQKLRGK